MPKTMTDVLQLHIDAEKAFLQLPLDVRSQFGNDVNRWIATAGSDEWLKLMKLDVSDPVQQEVKDIEEVKE